jgi:hypothetical protein
MENEWKNSDKKQGERRQKITNKKVKQSYYRS